MTRGQGLVSPMIAFDNNRYPTQGQIRIGENGETYIFDNGNWRLKRSTFPKFRHVENYDELVKWYDEDYCINQIIINHENFIYVKYHTLKVYEIALEIDPTLILFMDIVKFPEIWELYRLRYE